MQPTNDGRSTDSVYTYADIERDNAEFAWWRERNFCAILNPDFKCVVELFDPKKEE